MQNLHKAFCLPSGGMLEVLRGVTFEVAAGEMLAIMGASGAGKSTLLHLLGGLEAPDEGSIKLCEDVITKANGARLARVRNEMIGFVFQSHHLLPDLTAAENVAMPLLISRASMRESMSRARLLLERIGLGERVGHRVGNLSGGEQQRVAIARAMMREPRLLLADEPTGNLDAAVGDEIGEIITSFCRQHNAAVVIATHNKRLANACDRLLLLQGGKLNEVQSPKSKTQSQNPDS